MSQQPDAQPRRRRYARRMTVDERREQLLTAALAVLDRDGYPGLSVEAIAREAGVTRPVVYAVFDGLRDLLDALLDQTRERALNQALALMDHVHDHSDVGAWVSDMTSTFLSTVQDDPQVWRPVLGLVRGAPPEVSERIDTTRDLICAQLATGLRERTAGHGEADAELYARIALASAEELARAALRDPAAYTPARVASAYSVLLDRHRETR
ncbi:TetR/AcrR family transcriptional regulator [Luteipulveratus halotolerans]|uniref:TetR/AcrR family transcriptional regulator n=1 Tax=Luteipulveratus halotolerans TaxID=1631356 RepID=UPI00068195D8|nr:helix-turn-helix domain-containing protein [Luteipulveratus halotolerans]